MNWWYLSLVSVVLALLGTFFLAKSIVRSRGKLMLSLFFLFVAGFFGPGEHLLLSAFGILTLDIQNSWWNIMPLFYTCAMFFVVLSMKSLDKLFTDLQKSVRTQGVPHHPHIRTVDPYAVPYRAANTSSKRRFSS